MGGRTQAYGTVFPDLRRDIERHGEVFDYSRPRVAVGTALADSLSDTYLKQAMCMDLVFRKDLDFGDVPGDSLASTSGNVFHHPSYLLSGATEVPVSNGRIWKTSALKHKPEESWLKTIVVEAENTAGRESNYAVISSRSASSTSFRDSVSEGRFIEVAATSENPRQQPWCSLPCRTHWQPNTTCIACLLRPELIWKESLPIARK